MRGKFLSCLLIMAVAASMILVGFIPQVQAAEKKEIVFGGSLGLSGTFAEISRHIKDSFELWFEDTNKAGGIYVKKYGRKLPVRWIVYDDQSDPGIGSKLMEKLITGDKVDFVTAPFSSGITFPQTTVAEKHKKIIISYCGSSNEIFTRGFDYTFDHIGLAGSHFSPAIDLINHLEPRPEGIAIVASKELYTLTVAEASKRQLKDLGFDVVLYEEIPVGVKDASSIINKMKALDVDVFLGCVLNPATALFTKQMKALNCRPKMIDFVQGSEMGWYIKEFGKYAEGIMGKFPAYADPKDPMIIEFTKRIKEKDPTWPLKTCDAVYHCQPYDTCEMIRQGVEATGSLDNTKIAEWLRTHEIPGMLQGIGHKAKFQDYDNYKNINVNITGVVCQNQHGEPVVVWPPEYAAAKYLYPLGPWQK